MASGEAPADLDACLGHDEGGAYHDHAGETGSNAILGCLVAEVGCIQNDPAATCDASAERRPQP